MPTLDINSDSTTVKTIVSEIRKKAKKTDDENRRKFHEIQKKSQNFIGNIAKEGLNAVNTLGNIIISNTQEAFKNLSPEGLKTEIEKVKKQYEELKKSIQ